MNRHLAKRPWHASWRCEFVALLALVALVAPAQAAAPNAPDPARTPGVADSSVTEANFREELCSDANGTKYHTTDAKRPSTSYTNGLKKRQLNDWGYTDKRLAHYEEDHLISLELGGDPASEKNLWPEPYSGSWGARVKDTLETELGQRACLAGSAADHVSLHDARDAVATDWITAYKKYVCGRTRKAMTDKMKAQCKLH